MNPNPKIIFNPTKMLISEIFFMCLTIFLLLGCFIVYLMIIALLSEITLFNFMLTSIITLILFSLSVFLMYHQGIVIKQPIIYFRYKKVFSEHPITSDSDFVAVTNGKYGYHDEVRSQIRKFIDAKLITGCKLAVIDGEWKLVCPLTNEPLVPQHLTVDKDNSTTDSAELISELTNLSELLNNSENSGSTPVNELAILSKLLESGTITEEEFKKVKNDLLNRK